MFTIKSIQADYGDSLLVGYGTNRHDLRYMLIDGGTADATANLLDVLAQHKVDGRLRLEALVITHYDFDHIGGIIELLKEPPPWLDIADVWFNGRKHLFERDVLGPADGDTLSEQLEGHYPWNLAFGGKAIKSGAGKITLEGGLDVWVVSPDQPRLTKLAASWPKVKDDAKKPADVLGATDVWPPGAFSAVASRPFKKDDSVANGSSIAIMLGFDGKLALLTGDAHPDVVSKGISIHWPGVQPKVSLLKLSHHGSKGNTSEQLLKAIDCDRYLISTNGDRFKHPDVTLFAKILKVRKKPIFLFNYSVDRTLWWQNIPDGWPSFTSSYPESGALFKEVEI
ncbi:ComEC/Rec2 family competence protein [Sinorhizobium meliloti]|uniref:ComEC/Rec2 family competence protein n=1 Tax=Rhizobium meliloti TaxID=382 RepID=UPI0018E85DC6|nr:MBL fold metallo-hydrolase [Sinorhizobium meliloti]QQF06971.1 MBL fold metallo-hydrolase [Sinorhizobium meliloti]